MTTITFYSYKGGAGRSLALANAAVYLATLGFRVVALDFDLEAPGLHYKLSRNEDGSPLAVRKGVIDYVNTFLSAGQVSAPLKEFVIDVAVPSPENPLIHLIPSGQVPSADYWSQLSRINWHDLFYRKGAKGVQIFMELQARIYDELKPDYLLVDSRTGITEMGGVATSLFADKVVCLVLPTPENLEGARAVLRSLKRSRRETEGTDLEMLVAVSRLPQMKGSEDERVVTDRIISVMNTEAENPEDTLTCHSVFVLHSEAALQIQEALRVGSGINPDDSILLRDYLRLFAGFVPKESIDPKVHDLIEKAWAKLRHDPDGAVKDMEVLAESFAHPENYRELLRFYQVRNVSGTLTLKRAQRLWELTRESGDPTIWQAITRSFEPQPTWRRGNEWYPSLDFIRAVWRSAGGKDPAFGMKLAAAYDFEDRESAAADVLLEVIRSSEPTPTIVARCVALLDTAKRTDEAEELIQQLKTTFVGAPEFANAWARHAIRTHNKSSFIEISKSPWVEKVRPALRGPVYRNAGLAEEAVATAEHAIRDLRERDFSRWELEEIGEYFYAVGRGEEFDTVVADIYPGELARDLHKRAAVRLARRR